MSPKARFCGQCGQRLEDSSINSGWSHAEHYEYEGETQISLPPVQTVPPTDPMPIECGFRETEWFLEGSHAADLSKIENHDLEERNAHFAEARPPMDPALRIAYSLTSAPPPVVEPVELPPISAPEPGAQVQNRVLQHPVFVEDIEFDETYIELPQPLKIQAKLKTQPPSGTPVLLNPRQKSIVPQTPAPKEETDFAHATLDLDKPESEKTGSGLIGFVVLLVILAAGVAAWYFL